MARALPTQRKIEGRGGRHQDHGVVLPYLPKVSREIPEARATEQEEVRRESRTVKERMGDRERGAVEGALPCVGILLRGGARMPALQA